MQRISSPHYPLTRQLLPILKQRSVLIAAGTVTLLLVVSGMWILLTMPLMVLMLLLVIHQAPNIVLQNFCQDAWVDEAGILLQRKDEQIHLPNEQIEKITWHGWNNPPRAKIHLKSATPQGSLFTIVPDLAKGRRAARENIEKLNAEFAN